MASLKYAKDRHYFKAKNKVICTKWVQMWVQIKNKKPQTNDNQLFTV